MTLFSWQSHNIPNGEHLQLQHIKSVLQRSRFTRNDGSNAATTHHSVAIHTAVLPAYCEEQEQRAVRKGKPPAPATHENGHRQRHFTSRKLALASANTR